MYLKHDRILRSKSSINITPTIFYAFKATHLNVQINYGEEYNACESRDTTMHIDKCTYRIIFKLMGLFYMVK